MDVRLNDRGSLELVDVPRRPTGAEVTEVMALVTTALADGFQYHVGRSVRGHWVFCRESATTGSQSLTVRTPRVDFAAGLADALDRAVIREISL